MDINPVEISVVVPLYCEESNLDCLFERLESVLGQLNIHYEIICVDDGSKDKTFEQLLKHHFRNCHIKVIALSRNFGKEIALTAGIDFARGRPSYPLMRIYRIRQS